MTVWTPEIIRARFVEAAHTEQFLPPALSPSSRGYWPEFFHDEEDKKGWDDAARLDNAEKRKGRAPMGAISRHAECLQWTISILNDEKRRHIVWSWAFCRAKGWDFGSRCAKRGWKRPTAYRRLAASVEAIADNLNNTNVLLHLPDDKWLRHETPSMPSMCASEETRDGGSAAIKFTPGFRTEKSTDLLQTPEAVADFAKFLERQNARRRKLQAWRNEGSEGAA